MSNPSDENRGLGGREPRSRFSESPYLKRIMWEVIEQGTQCPLQKSTHMYAHIHNAHMHTHVYTHTCTHMHIHAHVRAHAYTHTHMHINSYVQYTHI